VPAHTNVFEADPGLLHGMSPDRVAAVFPHGMAETRSYFTRAPGPTAGPGDDGFGLLVIEGLVARSVSLAGRSSVELLGAGDLLRPWDDSRAHAPVPIDATLRVLEDTEVAVLDREFAARVAPWPEVAIALCGRLVERSRWLALLLLVGRLPHVEARLVVLFWHLADRWGSVRRDGSVVVPLRLTHETLGALVSAERPTVSLALKRLSERRVVDREEDAWVVHGSPPTTAQLNRQAFAEAFRVRRRT
jgi:CRP/FNR family cyclic AMP-dependent transcriptional regulator